MPIPGPGVQLTTLSHVEDLAAMMALVPGNPKALKQHFNLCSDRCITFDGIARAVAQAVRNILFFSASCWVGDAAKGDEPAYVAHTLTPGQPPLNKLPLLSLLLLLAQAGKEATIVHYDPAAMKLGKGEGFPFRCVGGY